MPLISNSTVKLVKVTSLLDRPITGTAEYVIYCVDNGVDPKTYWIWKNSAWEEIYTTITDQYIITRQLTGLTITGGTVTSTDTILSAFGKLQNQLNAVASPMVYQGTWNANTNFPALTSSVGTKGHVYRVTTSGATNIDGTTDWKSGDFIVFNGATWDKWDSTDAVTSVNGYVGNVVLVKSDVGLGNVPNVDATNPANIVQNTNYRFVTDTEKTYWNGKQDALGYVPEDVANKATTMTGNTASNVKYLTSKAVYDWGTSTFIPLNAPIVGATKTKITYDSKGLVTAGADATTADIADSLNKRYVTDANLIVINNTSNTNTGDETQTSIKTKLGEASATQDGYLSAFYWSAFNNKQSAISLTNIGNSGAASFISNTLNIPVYTISGLGGVSTSRNINTTAPLQGGGDLSADRTLSITQATISSSGYLSSTDWNIFNDKQNALSGGILNRITKWTSTTGIGNSQIADDGTSIAIGASLNSTVQLGIATNKTTALRASSSTGTGISGVSTNATGGAGVKGESTGGYGLFGISNSTTVDNVGVYGSATDSVSLNIGGKFVAGGISGSKYSVQLQDGTESIGKFLKSITVDGKANWANVTLSDISGSHTGTGTTNYVTKWTGTTSQGNGIIFDDGSLVGIGTATPTAKLHVNNLTTSDSLLIEDNTNPDASPFVVDNNGNVGVGIAIPNTLGRLVVQGNGANGLVLNTDSATTTQSTRLFFRQSDTNDVSMFNVSGNLRFAFSGTTNSSSGNAKFIMTSTGSLLVNSTSPTVTPASALTTYATGVASSAEEIARFGVYSVSSPGTPIAATLAFRNGTTTDDEFLPMLRGAQATASTLSSLQIDALIATAQDTAGNTNPALVVRTGNSTGAALINRPLLDIRNGSSSAITVLPGPLVGINTTNPQSTLDVTGVGGFRVTDGGLPNQYIFIGADSVLSQNTILSRHEPGLGADFIINSTSDGIDTNSGFSLKLQTYSVDAIVIDSTQKVGIGNSLPTAKLHVNNTTTNLSLLVEDGSNPDPYPFVVDNDGSVGIGMLTPLAKLHVFTGSTLPALLIEDTVSPDPSPFIISNTGSVGIGTTTPSTNLHINSATSGAFRLVDTTQGVNKYLKSDTNGVGTWSALSVADTGLTITTTGTSGPATLVGNTLNIPQYSGGGGGSQTLAQTLALGNTTGTNDVILSSGTFVKSPTSKFKLSYDETNNQAILLGSNVDSFGSTIDKTFTLGNGASTIINQENYSGGSGYRYGKLSVGEGGLAGLDCYQSSNNGIAQVTASTGASNDPQVSIAASNNSGGVQILVKNTIITVENPNTSNPGIEYVADYSANFTARTLVDKAYVDTAVSTVTAGSASSVSHTVKAGIALTKGQAVYVSSADGTNMIVSKADYSVESTSSKTMGLIAQNLSLNGIGQVITEGLLAGLDTSTANAGDPVWLGDDGNLLYGLANKPSAPNHIVFIGIVTRKNNINGEIFVKPQNGFEVHELHDVSINSIANNDVLTYETATGLWKNKPQAFNYGLSYTVATQNLLY